MAGSAIKSCVLVILAAVTLSAVALTASETAPEPTATWQPAPPVPPPPLEEPTVTLTGPEGSKPTIYLRSFHPSGSGHAVIKNLSVVGASDPDSGEPESVLIAAADNGTTDMTIENVDVRGAPGTKRGGDVTVRAGNGGPQGPGGDLKAIRSTFTGGNAE